MCGDAAERKLVPFRLLLTLLAAAKSLITASTIALADAAAVE